MTRLPGFESEPCSRCGGTGHYSYCSMYGTTCFKCSGNKRQLTKRGRVAYDFYRASIPRKPASELVPGDSIRLPGFRRFNVTDAWIETQSGAIDPETGHVRPHPAVKSAKLGTYSFGTYDQEVEMVPPIEERRRLWTLALEYQETLTKAGKVRKRRPAKQEESYEDDTGENGKNTE